MNSKRHRTNGTNTHTGKREKRIITPEADFKERSEDAGGVLAHVHHISRQTETLNVRAGDVCLEEGEDRAEEDDEFQGTWFQQTHGGGGGGGGGGGYMALGSGIKLKIGI